VAEFGWRRPPAGRGCRLLNMNVNRLAVWIFALAGVAWWPAPLPAADRAKLLEQADRSATGLRKHLLVVYNKNAPDSERLARYYAIKRGIPKERILGVSTSREEEIDRETFAATIWSPINSYIEKQGWIERRVGVQNVNGRRLPVQTANRNDVWAMVLMKGMPLKIKKDPEKNDVIVSKQPGANNNGASVDSELATLPTLGLPISGMLPNPYFFSGYPRPFDAVDARKLILVTRLDAPTSAMVERMIDDAIHAERHRLSGRGLFDIRGLPKNHGYRRGDDWIRGAFELFRREGWDVTIEDHRGLVSERMPIRDIGFYAGWYRQEAEGPMFRDPVRFRRGAIAYHLHSFSAHTLRSDKKGWVGPLLAHGAAASMGCVYEPYLAYTPQVDVFVDRLTQHFTFAESAYMSQRSLSWMTVFVGDPLYRPFALPLDRAVALEQKQRSELALWLQAEVLRRKLRHPNSKVDKIELRTGLLRGDSGSLTWEAYGDMLVELDVKKHQDDIFQAYEMAANLAAEPMDIIRIGEKQVTQYRRVGKKGLAASFKQELAKQWPEEAVKYGLVKSSKKDKPEAKQEEDDFDGIRVKKSQYPRAEPVTPINP